MTSNLFNSVGLEIRLNREEASMPCRETAIIEEASIRNIQQSKEVAKYLGNGRDNSAHQLNNQQIFEMCNEWFKFILRGKIKEVEEFLPIIENNKDKIQAIGFSRMIDVHMLSYYVQKKMTDKAKIQYETLQHLFSSLKGTEIYYWFKFSGDYYYFLVAYSDAQNAYVQAEKMIEHDIGIDIEEEMDLYYLRALTASRLKKTHICFSYAEKALTYYDKELHLVRIAECHILLGIAYVRIGEPINAKEHYFTALEIGERLNSRYILDLCNQNLGRLADKTLDYKNAVYYYTKCYQSHKNSDNEEELIPISSLMKAHYEQGDLKTAEKWLQKGINLSEKLKFSNSIYLYEFRVYYHLIKGFDDSFESLMLNEVIPFLQRRKLLYEEHIYLKILADYYFFEAKKYKLSANCYNDALHSLAKLKRKKVIS
ncbi:tetratricopeptide (TPR) repeat protein [Natronobacillus azotifigens]|uniref:Tetratricopeptide repeat protein n=1 Tax=Natronobacillus azotifigens TaxID=472978 RepID=A0A9J6RCV8_9BACI|nr:hypothetical protein [Natronobacillus azotifigens]MCZ0703182.1 hypothetical protein [Natronobacillus azotifigens]